MAKRGARQPSHTSQVRLAEAVREVASSLQANRSRIFTQHMIDRDADDRGRLAEKIMAWANLVFAGMVVAQALSDSFDHKVALVGAGLFVGAYLIAYGILRGGER